MTRDQRRAAVRAAVAAAIRQRGAAAGARVVVVIREGRRGKAGDGREEDVRR